jgi:hypothetical protein
MFKYLEQNPSSGCGLTSLFASAIAVGAITYKSKNENENQHWQNDLQFGLETLFSVSCTECWRLSECNEDN